MEGGRSYSVFFILRARRIGCSCLVPSSSFLGARKKGPRRVDVRAYPIARPAPGTARAKPHVHTLQSASRAHAPRTFRAAPRSTTRRHRRALPGGTTNADDSPVSLLSPGGGGQRCARRRRRGRREDAIRTRADERIAPGARSGPAHGPLRDSHTAADRISPGQERRQFPCAMPSWSIEASILSLPDDALQKLALAVDEDDLFAFAMTCQPFRDAARICSPSGTRTACAAMCTSTERLAWARWMGCRWDYRTCADAAAGGHLEVLQWAREQGCPCDGHGEDFNEDSVEDR